MSEQIVNGELTLVNRDEKPFSQKILAILGGITSFGALFPLFLKYISRFTEIKDPYWPFKIFMLLYFVLPIIVFAIWYFSTRYVRYTEWKEDKKGKDSPIFGACLLVQMLIGINFILFPIDRVAPQGACWIIFFFTVLWFIMLGYFTWQMWRAGRRVYIFVSLLLAVILFLTGISLYKYVANAYPDKKTGLTEIDTSRKAYLQLTTIENLVKSISSVEMRTRNISERFRLKSHMRWTMDNVHDSIARQFLKVSQDATCNRRYNIKPYTDFLNALILNKDLAPDIGSLKIVIADSVDAKSPVLKDLFIQFLIRNRLDSTVNYENSSFFNAARVYREYLLKKWQLQPDGSVVTDPMAYIYIIDKTIYQTLDENRQIVHLKHYDTCNPVLSRLAAAFGKGKGKDTQCLRMGEVGADTLARFSDFLDEQNSQILYSWIQDFIAFAQRRAEDQITSINQKITWVFRDAQTKGLLIFITFILSLLLYYGMISSRETKWRNEAMKEINEEKESADPKKTKEDLDLRLKLLNFHLFPIITFLGITIALIIPLTKPIKSDEINTSRPDWFLALPNWNIVGALSQSVRETILTDMRNKKDGPENPNKIQIQLDENLARKDDVYQARDTIKSRTERVQTDLDEMKKYVDKKEN